MSHNLIVFPGGCLAKKREIAVFIIANGPILGIAEFNFAKKGKIRKN